MKVEGVEGSEEVEQKRDSRSEWGPKPLSTRSREFERYVEQLDVVLTRRRGLAGETK